MFKGNDISPAKTSWIGGALQSLRQQAFYNSYRKSFTIAPAETATDIAQCLRLRYDVFCRENGFLDPALYPDGEERDEFDARAIHYRLMHNQSGRLAGTVRVILPDPERPLTSFALQKVCDHPLLQIENRMMGIAEISRLCMAREFRRRPRDGHILPAYHTQESADENGRRPLFRRQIPYAPLGLMAAAFETVLRAGLLDVVMSVDPAQFRTLKRIGMNYRVLGPRLNWLGSQQPFIFNIKTALDTMAAENPPCWEVASDRGRLHRRADELSRYHWQDEIFDEMCHEMILRKLI